MRAPALGGCPPGLRCQSCPPTITQHAHQDHRWGSRGVKGALELPLYSKYEKLTFMPAAADSVMGARRLPSLSLPWRARPPGSRRQSSHGRHEVACSSEQG